MKHSKPKSKYTVETQWSLANGRGLGAEDVGIDARDEAAAIKAAVAQDYPFIVKTTVLWQNDTDLVQVLSSEYILRPDLARLEHPTVLVGELDEVAAVIR